MQSKKEIFEINEKTKNIPTSLGIFSMPIKAPWYTILPLLEY